MANKAAKPVSKSEVLSKISGETGLSRKQVSAVIDSLAGQVKAGLGKRGPGVFVIPGLVKIVKVHKEAQPEREGINPFTKEKTIFKAKPARNVIKVRALKRLKEMV